MASSNGKKRPRKEILEDIRSILWDLEELRRAARIPPWDVTVWVLSGALGIFGIIIAPPTGGLSLLVTVASFLLMAIDMAKKIYERATDEVTRQKAKELKARLEGLQAELKALKDQEEVAEEGQ